MEPSASDTQALTYWLKIWLDSSPLAIDGVVAPLSSTATVVAESAL